MNSNPDGWGIMAVIDGMPIVQKGGIPKEKGVKGKKTPDEVKAFLDVYDFFKSFPHAVHFRIQTHGDVNEENCHPYTVGESTYLMHNGTLNQFSFYNYKTEDKTKSDTWNFAEAISKMIDCNWLRDESFVRLMNIIVGENNRILFMDEQGFYMPRPDLWVKRDEIYFSNNHGIEYLRDNFRNNNQTSNGHYPHGHNGAIVTPNNDQESLKIPFHKGHLFCSDGSRIIQLDDLAVPEDTGPKKPESETSSNDSQISLLEVTNRNEMSEEDQKKALEQISFYEKLPKTAMEWKEFSLHTITELLYTEPEMVADVVWDMVHA